MTETSSTALEYFDLRYSSEPASSYYLLIEIDDRNIKACWYNHVKNLITGLARYPLQGHRNVQSLQSLLNAIPMLHTDFQQTIITVRCSNFTLVPRAMHKVDSQQLFIVTNEYNSEREVILDHSMVGLPAYVLMALDKDLPPFLTHSFFNAIIVPHVAPILEQHLKSTAIKDSMFHVHITDDHLDVMVLKNGKLELANSFYQCNKEDIAYYTLYSAEVLDIDTSTAPLRLSGTIAEGDETWTLLATYWEDLEISKPLSVPVSERCQEYPKGMFDYLTYSLLCAS